MWLQFGKIIVRYFAVTAGVFVVLVTAATVVVVLVYVRSTSMYQTFNLRNKIGFHQD